MKNEYIPFSSQVKEIIPHTDIEYTFRMSFPEADRVKPGQFFEVSIPKYGEAPISVSGIGEDYVDLTIRRVGRVTNKIFQHYEGNTLLMRGPYGNGFDLPIADPDNTVFITVGPPVMIKFTIMEILKRGIKEGNIWISHERKMCCGLGKCGHCKMNDTYVCLDGPVFNYAESRDLID